MKTLYTEHHLWVAAQPDGTLLAGISPHAQNMLGDIVYVDFPAVAGTLVAGHPCGVIESVKTASDLHAPMDGEVVEINESLRDKPEQLNDAPESAWIFRFRPSNPSQAESLMSEQAYQAYLDA